jgi:hypothetical protein
MAKSLLLIRLPQEIVNIAESELAADGHREISHQ